MDAQDLPLSVPALGRSFETAPRPTLLGTSSETVNPINSSSPVPPANYDEQLGITFTQNFTGLSYNVTAVEQQNNLGYGPAYLLNGLTNLGYWFQVGLSWDWPITSGGYYGGFGFNYEVFSPNGSSVYPPSAGGIGNFSGPIDPGNKVGLSLAFVGDTVLMQALDYETGAIASTAFQSYGADIFLGLPNAISNSEGFFTGLMTEQYHATVYNGSETKVTFSGSNNITSAWMWVDEFNANTSSLVFFRNMPVTFASSPRTLQYFFFEGAILISNAYEFVTGTSGLILLTVSYDQVGSPPTQAPRFVYFSNGSIQSSLVGEKPTTFLVDNGSSWSISSTLQNSSVVRWATSNSTFGVATSDRTIKFLYYQQFLDNISLAIVGGGSNSGLPSVNFTNYGQPNVTLISSSPFVMWGDAGTSWNASTELPGSSVLERWVANGTSGIFEPKANSTLTYYHEKLVSVGYSVTDDESGYSPPQFESSVLNETVERTLSTLPYILWLNSGAAWNVSSYLNSSISTERWVTTDPRGTVNEAVISPLYFHQSLVTFQYLVRGNSTGFGNPTVDWFSFGIPMSAVLRSPTQAWADYGSSYNFTRMVSSSSSLERWIPGPNSSGTIFSQPSVNLVYQTQYYVAISQPRLGGGVVLSVPSGWYNASSAIQVTAQIDSGWKLSSWAGTGAGSYTGNSTDPFMAIESPVTETIVLYPAITISASKGGTVSYEYSGKSGFVSGGHNVTIYIPPLTKVSLSASSSSDLNIFTSWNGAVNSGSKSILLQARAPEKLEAGFGFNYPIVAVSTIAVLLLILLIVASIYRRKERSGDPIGRAAWLTRSFS